MPAATAFEFMADGLKQDHWALGSVNRKALGDGLFIGQNSFDGSDLYVRLASDPELLLVDYSTGPSPEELTPRVEARIRPGSWVGLDDSALRRHPDDLALGRLRRGGRGSSTTTSGAPRSA